jgi:RNA polymerase sigma-70 factor (ECF subfamily)
VFPQTTTHTTLLARLSQGSDPVAWREFCDRYGELIRSFARQQKLQPADCDDVLQDVLTALTQSMPQFQYDPKKGRFRSYLKTVVTRAISRRIRQRRGELPLDNSGDDAVSPSPDVEQVWEAEWRQYHLRQAMRAIEAEMNPTDRAAFARYALRGEGARKTAESLGLSVDQVYQAKSRILKRLSQIIEHQVQEEG